MAATKRQPAIGERKWQVSWCSKLAFYDYGDGTDVDHDSCTEDCKAFRTHEEARAFAERIYAEVAVNTFGIVEVDEYVYASCDDDEYPWLCEWQLANEHSEIFSGEWES